MELIVHIITTGRSTILDVAPIAIILLGFQFLVLRSKPANMGKIAVGFGYVLAGLTLFLVGLELALFPIGETMALQLTAPDFIQATVGSDHPDYWRNYLWVYAFAAAIGFATTIAEPSLMAVAIKAETVSGGAIKALGLRIAVAVGVAVGVSLGAYRIVTGTPLPYYIMAGYIIVIIQTFRASKFIIPLAYDSGGVTTSTVTVPVVTALGLGLASTIPGRSPLLDGFGLIAFASVFPIIAVLGFASFTDWRNRRRKDMGKTEDSNPDANEKPDTGKEREQ
ncbi:MAG: DUF1538 domain-containing protein [Rhodospirillaceae bacterium]|jgi:hypothetical protein|nr:DUF1538 domain-containing protein [Rhodospirillaceae bacterium]MBT4219806.1 DUF1538 domain-containing protein [Rhodospirillaceae bacterium]MBT4464606.1 DUF1538 domain-containing protein [Rhodospirillaceae bacterium]MBT5013194.1 DUF1538 domain-containing protein [Rhodospirillaceae bacterium]MBT5308734.1 DUF1538 domain-containing protein [Rhodospirillaceae bacterium]